MMEKPSPRRSKCGLFVYIPLGHGRETVVDADFFEASAKHHSWHLRKCRWRDGAYAMTRIEGRTVLMHRLIMNAPRGDRRVVVDHINRDGLDNRRENLRICTVAENMRNTRARFASTSPYKGVYWHAGDEKWAAEIQVDGKKVHLGKYNDERAAAVIHNLAAAVYHGEFANLNQVPRTEKLVNDLIALRRGSDAALARAEKAEAHLAEVIQRWGAWGKDPFLGRPFELAMDRARALLAATAAGKEGE